VNILRKAMGAEVERLKPRLDRAYHAIVSYQERRDARHEAELRAALLPAITQLMVFRPYLPAYKQEYFNVLETDSARLAPGELIMLFDHCVSIMHLRLERASSGSAEELGPWSARFLAILDERRAVGSGAAEGEFLCSGFPAAPGRVVGVVRVVRESADLAALAPGEVLVCRMTTPDWLGGLRRVVALVTDEGGALCHAAIVARELGIPCVAGCRNATATLRDGQLVEVNGDLGLVTGG
jgi:phosphohistidine swiveling domain-containing protein